MFADCKIDDVHARAEQMREGAKMLRLEHDGRTLGTLSLSMGIAMFPDHGRTADELLAAADAALYRSKSDGRDRTSVAGSQRLVVEPPVGPPIEPPVEPPAPAPGPIARSA